MDLPEYRLQNQSEEAMWYCLMHKRDKQSAEHTEQNSAREYKNESYALKLFGTAAISTGIIASAVGLVGETRCAIWMFALTMLLGLIEFDIWVHRNHQAKFKLTVGGSSLVAVAVIAGAGWLTGQSGAELYHVSRGAGANMSKSPYPQWAAASSGPDGLYLQPIDLMLDIVVENMQSVPSIVKEYSLDSGLTKHGPWTALCPVSSEFEILWINPPALSTAMAMTFKPTGLLETKLLDREIGSHKVISGWTLWECPSGDCGNLYFRFRLFDAAGNKQATVLRWTDVGPSQWGLVKGNALGTTGPLLNLTNRQPRVVRSCGKKIGNHRIVRFICLPVTQ